MPRCGVSMTSLGSFKLLFSVLNAPYLNILQRKHLANIALLASLKSLVIGNGGSIFYVAAQSAVSRLTLV